MALYHISDRPDIPIFLPRLVQGASVKQPGAMVWAIDEEHLHNYLVPRNCPRVCIAPAEDAEPGAWDRLACGSTARAIVAIESGWYPAVRNTTLYQYVLPEATFTTIDRAAGYAISYEPVTPEQVIRLDDPLGMLLERGVELRIMPSLWPLRDRVIDSGLQFSIIRMRNAQPPPAGYIPRYPVT